MLRWLLAIATALLATDSLAQISGSASAVSDYRFRGVSLSNGQPAAQADVSYDHDSGWYEGLFASNVRFDYELKREAQVVGFAGYARRVQNGLSVDTGATYSTFSGGDGYNYAELHAGFTSTHFSGRIYYAPNYFGRDFRTLYAELNASQRLTDRLRLIGHAGVLKPVSTPDDRAAQERARVDLQAAVELLVKSFTLQVGRIANDGASRVYPVRESHTGGIWTVRLSVSF